MKITIQLVARCICLIFLAQNALAQKVLANKQRLQISEHTLSCYQPGADRFLVFDDSLHYWSYSPKKGYWQQQDFRPTVGMPWAAFKENHVVHATDAKHIYFIDKGCGVVYLLQDDSLVRVDYSYPHKNQFGAAIFTYNSKVHFFGGYGLFRTKNLVTVYDPGAREWFEITNLNYEIRPKGRQGTLHQLVGNQLYIWGGYARLSGEDVAQADLWVFDLTNQRWRQEGELNPNLLHLAEHLNMHGKLPTTWFPSRELLVHTSLKDNKIYTYANPRFLTYQSIEPNSKETHFLVLHKATNSKQVSAVVLDQPKLTLGIEPGQQYFYKRVSVFKNISTDIYLWFSLILNLVLLLLLFYIRRIHKTDWFKRRNPELKRSEFSNLEWECLQLIAKHESIELSALNDLFDEEALSYETLKKRRESFIKALRTKIALLTALNVDDILPETKHPKDKRMKVINWSKHLNIKDDK
jgi:hypothetical protein